MTGAEDTQSRRNAIAEPARADKLTGHTCAILDQFGVSMSPSKVSRLVHRYQYRIAPTGYPFAAWIANSVALAADQRRVLADQLTRVVAYADPTGEQATARVIRDRGF